MNKILKIKKYNQISKLFWPIAITLILTNSLSLVDSVIIAKYNIYGVSAIASATQIQMLFGPIYFAILSAVNIYSVQYFTKKDFVTLKKLAGIALSIIIPFSIFNFIIVSLFGVDVLSMFTQGDINVTPLALEYLNVYKYVIFLMPIDMFFVYQYRAMKMTKIPMRIGVAQAIINIVLDIVLLYLGYEMFGVALATFFAKFISIVIYIYVSFRIKVPFIGQINQMFNYSKKLFYSIFKNAIPLIVIEFGFGLSNFIYFKIYSLTGVDGLTQFTIAKNISFVINAFVIAVASVSGIMAGTYIAENMNKKEFNKNMKDLFKFMTCASIFLIVVSIFILPLLIPFFTVNYEYMKIIFVLLVINGIWMGLRVYSSSLIAILKSGNDNKFILFIEIAIPYLIAIPITYLLYRLGYSSIIMLRSVIIFEIMLKLSLGLYRYKKRKWVNVL